MIRFLPDVRHEGESSVAPTHLLDSSVYCQPLKPKPLASVEERWRHLGDRRLAISVICQAEVLYGIELKQSSGLFSLYEVLLSDRLRLLDVDRAVSGAFARAKASARRRGQICSDFDFLIGATAQVHGLILATLNPTHFRFIEGPAIEDWSRA